MRVKARKQPDTKQLYIIDLISLVICEDCMSWANKIRFFRDFMSIRTVLMPINEVFAVPANEVLFLSTN
jgi:hypothetical protein